MASMIEDAINGFYLGDDKLKELTSLMEAEFEKGLCKETNDKAEIKMLPAYVTETPNGKEEGDFLALDLGGTNFRVLLVKIDKGEVQMFNQVYAVSKELMTGTGVQLFDHLTECLWDFLVQHDMMCQLLPIGFTFSFPTKQYGIKKTTLVRWTKGYTATGVVGEDIGELLNTAINKKFKIRCMNFDLKIMSTVVNDTVGTMVSCAFDYPKTCMGLIVGTGTNMCYMEAQEKIKTLEENEVTPGKEMCINTEWGAFGNNSGALNAVITEFDKSVDEDSPNQGQQIYEKMISGMYMGELVRRVVVKLMDAGLMFVGTTSDSILYTSGLSTAFVSQVLSYDYNQSDFDLLKNYISGFGAVATNEDCVVLKRICEAVSLRAADLCAVGVVATAKRVVANRGNVQVIVGVDGSVYRRHPTFKDLLVKKTMQLAPDIDIRFELSTDGSGRGAALVAAVESRIHKLQLK
uniref:Phosphotransferase n=1 Tax=Phallusia mammillata TaxID=59560 RepID=A0A6F9DF17_9ASCI|nr:hexokinase-1 [Phallusia mammillata]